MGNASGAALKREREDSFALYMEQHRTLRRLSQRPSWRGWADRLETGLTSKASLEEEREAMAGLTPSDAQFPWTIFALNAAVVRSDDMTAMALDNV